MRPRGHRPVQARVRPPVPGQDKDHWPLTAGERERTGRARSGSRPALHHVSAEAPGPLRRSLGSLPPTQLCHRHGWSLGSLPPSSVTNTVSQAQLTEAPAGPEVLTAPGRAARQEGTAWTRRDAVIAEGSMWEFLGVMGMTQFPLIRCFKPLGRRASVSEWGRRVGTAVDSPPRGHPPRENPARGSGGVRTPQPAARGRPHASPAAARGEP